VQVVPQGDRVVLRGSVNDDQMRQSFERAARRAVSSVPIENQIQVSSSR